MPAFADIAEFSLCQKACLEKYKKQPQRPRPVYHLGDNPDCRDVRSSETGPLLKLYTLPCYAKPYIKCTGALPSLRCGMGPLWLEEAGRQLLPVDLLAAYGWETRPNRPHSVHELLPHSNPNNR